MKRLYCISILVILAATTSCNRLLDQWPSDKIAGGNMWQSESQVDQGVIGVYNALKESLPGTYTSTSALGFYGYDILGVVGQSRYSVGLYTSGSTANDAIFSTMWTWCYTGINRANAAIAAIPKVNMSQEKKDRLLAECKILRAFFYTRLNELFGRGIGVPIYKEVVAPTEYIRGQSPEADVWSLIVTDLTEAIETDALRDNDIGGDGRANRGAAYAMRGRVYLMTGRYSDAASDFSEVSKCGYGLYTEGSAPYRDLFKVENERCKEMIFSIQYIEEPTGYGSRNQLLMGAGQQGAKDGGTAWTNMQVAPAAVDLYEVIVDANTVKPFVWNDVIPEWNGLSPDERKVFFIRDKEVGGAEIHETITKVIDDQIPAATKSLYQKEGNEARIKSAYANRDPRLAYNVITPYADFKGINNTGTEEAMYTLRYPTTGPVRAGDAADERKLKPTLPETYYTSGTANDHAVFYYIYRKFVGEGLEYAYMQDNPIDEPLIRYADVLLMWAEALVEQDLLSDAKAKVKEVRDRAGVPTMDSYFADKGTAREYVRNERRRELVGEGVNFLDEMRWKTLKESKFPTPDQTSKTVWGGVASSSIYNWPGDYFYTWPVPRGETDKNSNLKPTPGWNY